MVWFTSFSDQIPPLPRGASWRGRFAHHGHSPWLGEFSPRAGLLVPWWPSLTDATGEPGDVPVILLESGLLDQGLLRYLNSFSNRQRDTTTAFTANGLLRSLPQGGRSMCHICQI